MKLSIITINYNNPTGLEHTIKSIVCQSLKAFEYIIVDGASNKDDIDIIKKYENDITRWVSEPDKGIYNAMNKGVRLATGEYCLFMNSGDTLYSNTTVEELYKENLESDFIEGIIAIKSNNNKLHYPPKVINLSYYMYVSNNYHQASLIKRELLMKYPYDESYKISADMKFNMEVIVCHNCSYSTIPVIVSSYEGGGVSETVMNIDEVERKFKELFPQRILNDYEEMRFLYEWPVNRILPFLYKIGHSIRLYKFYLWIKGITGHKTTKAERIKLNRMENSIINHE